MFFSSQNITPALPALPVAPVGPGYNVAISACAGRTFDVAHGLFQEMFGARFAHPGRGELREIGILPEEVAILDIYIYVLTY